MAFQNGSYAKIKSIEDKGNYTKGKIAISKKIRGTDTYVCSFAGWVTFVGRAHHCRPMEGQRIKIISCDVSNGYLDRDGNQKFSNSPQYTIFEYELQQDGAQGNTYVPSAYTQGSSGGFEEMTIDDGGLPF